MEYELVVAPVVVVGQWTGNQMFTGPYPLTHAVERGCSSQTRKGWLLGRKGVWTGIRRSGGVGYTTALTL